MLKGFSFVATWRYSIRKKRPCIRRVIRPSRSVWCREAGVRDSGEVSTEIGIEEMNGRSVKAWRLFFCQAGMRVIEGWYDPISFDFMIFLLYIY